MNRNRQSKDDALNRELHRLMTSSDWTAPQTEDDVTRAEAELVDARAELPMGLRDPADVFERETSDEVSGIVPPAMERDVDAALRRAAREGGRLTPEIEQRMKRDRQAAEDDAEQQNDGADSR